ncbi:putative carboxypeptidase S1 [Halenospora varia]|nr:putative carboxypeptidase S1 [Halenospora varia]
MSFQFPHRRAILFTFIYLFSLATASDLNLSPELRGKYSLVERDGVIRTIFDHEATGAQLDFVRDSGVCETTPGVRQYSGYVNVANMSMWFWFFEARHEPETAPLAMWLNGGPGCSSMIGLFQENGPCHFINGSSTPSLNPHSWNEYANMLYVDEPIGVGFSYGINPVNSSVTAAPFVWTLLQAFFTSFPQYETRDFGLFTESYGGHYGPAFASYFESQNKAIASHQIHGHEINLVAMGINNGWYDTIIQEREFISFSVNNSYFPLINSSIAASYLSDYYSTCLPPSEKCTSTTGQNAECSAARAACGVVDDKYSVFYPNLDEYDIRQPASSPFPPQTYMTYLSDPSIMKAIGAKINYTMCSHAAGDAFHADADGNRSFLPTLSALIQSGLRTLIWAGDADSVCDWFGGFASVNSVSWSGGDTFRAKGVVNYTVKGVVGGEYKSVENLSWLRVFESGHEVPAFQPALALQAFKQTLGGKGIFST